MLKQLSFVIPVYNVESYLDECINSILVQANDAIEIILVDDGSTDKSGAICDRYSALNKNIHVIHQENQGHAAARNKGLANANGSYIAFVDSDDYIGAGCIKEIVEYIEAGGSDICFMDAVKFYPDGTYIDLGDDVRRCCVHGKSKGEVIDHLSMRPKYPGSACTKIFRRSFLIEKGICFPTHLLHSEDLSLCLEAILAAETYDALSIPYYFYRQNRPGSISSRINATMFNQLASFVKRYSNDLMNSSSVEKSFADKAMAFIAYEYSILLWRYDQLDKKEKKKSIRFIRDYQWVLKYGRTLKARVIYYVSYVLGARLTSKLLSLYMSRMRKSG